MKKTLLIFLLAIQLSVAGLAQQPKPSEQKPNTSPSTPKPPELPGDDDVVKITTNLVQLDPVITDKHGKIVTDLRADEVEILEDGKIQEITNFSFVSLETGERSGPSGVNKPIDKNAPPLPPVRLRPEDVRRTIAIVVDDLGMAHDSIYFTRQALKKFVDQQIQTGDLVAIIRSGGGIGALQSFTSDKRQLAAAIERVKFNPMSRGVGAFAPTSPDPMAVAGTAASEAFGVDRPREDEIDSLREDLFTVGTLGALNYVIRGLRELPGRKSVVVFSGGALNLLKFDGSQNFRVQNAMDRLIDLANRASVVIYAVDARGLETLNFTAADRHIDPRQLGGLLSARRAGSGSGAWQDLAEATGGFAVKNSNDLADGIRRALDDQKGYYLIGYRPDDSTFEVVRGLRRFHRITVRVKRPGNFKVRMRKGFFGVPEEEVMPGPKSPRDRLLAALTSPFGSAGVNLRLTSLFFNDSKHGSTMRSLLHIKASDLTFTQNSDGSGQSVIELIAMTFGDNGIVVDQLGYTHTLKLDRPAYENAVKHGVTYTINVPIKKPGAYQLRTALRDVASNQIGSASQFVEVPNLGKKRLVLSGIISRAVEEKTYQQRASVSANDGVNPDRTSENASLISNAARRQFKAGSIVEYGLAIYNAKTDKTGQPQVVTQVKLFRNGLLVFAGKELSLEPGNQTDLKRLEMTGAVQLGSRLDHGEYVLQVAVIDMLRKDKHRIATQWTDFEVVK
ncbi:MAG TPA: VWA domain-containing protein [Pyrinomonadaceae bacterium]|nr:VWA domain-containing protein [Pyrinomonadaceae bacterium]